MNADPKNQHAARGDVWRYSIDLLVANIDKMTNPPRLAVETIYPKVKKQVGLFLVLRPKFVIEDEDA